MTSSTSDSPDETFRGLSSLDISGDSVISINSDSGVS